MRFLDVGVDNFFEFLQRFPHDVDVLNVQEHKLGVLVLVTLIAPPCGLEKRRGGEREARDRRRAFFSTVS